MSANFGNNPADLFKVVLINKIKKVITRISLKTPEGEEVPVRDTIEKLTEYISDKLYKTEEDNVCRDQIYPLMSQAMIGGLVKLLGPHGTALQISDEETRYAMMHMMTVGFYLMKWLQQKDVKIHTWEEEISDEDIAAYERISKTSDLAVKYGQAGGDPKDLMKKLIEMGKIKKEDLEHLGIPDTDIEDIMTPEVKDKKESN